MDRIIRNKTLYVLGVILIELWYEKTLQQLQRPEDGEIETGDDWMTAWNTTNYLVDELYSEAGRGEIFRCREALYTSRIRLQISSS